MNRKLWSSLISFISLFLLAASNTGLPAPVVAAASQAGQAVSPPGAPQAPTDTPFTLLANSVTSYTISDPKVFYDRLPACQNPPPPAPTTNLYETIERIPTYGGQQRRLYSHLINTGTDLCPNNVDVMSNITWNGTTLYWVSSVNKGLVKLSFDANDGDKPSVINTIWAGTSEIAVTNGVLYQLTEPINNALLAINLTTGAFSALVTPGTGASDLHADGNYVFWLKGGVIHQWDISGGKELGTIGSGVTGYHPAGTTLYYGKGKDLYRFGIASRVSDLIYTSTDSTARIYSLAFDNNDLTWFEDHTLACPSPCLGGAPHDDYLYRSGPGGGSPTPIYVLHAPSNNTQASDLRVDQTYLFWLENGALRRMPEDASALPDINLVADGMEVTQGVQYKTNGVQLIKNRPTWVRFYVHSAGAKVPGVTAWLYRTDNLGNILDGPLPPANPAGELLTVLPSPQRYNLNDSFLFELPSNWTSGSWLYLRAIMNPNQYPLEPNYSDDDSGLYSFNLAPAPFSAYYIIEWGFSIKGTPYWPSYTDYLLTLSWLQRAYPIDSILGGPDFRFQVIPDSIYDAGLGSRVNQTSSECSDNLCASEYVNTQMQSMRDVWPIPDSTGMYGMIYDGVPSFWTRGQECCGTRVASGPAGLDVDGWYSGHEIGHTLGRQHPASGGAPVCPNQSADDSSFPYPHAQIGGTGSALEGFDAGDETLGLPLAIYPPTARFDVMSYCLPEWISDYTYNAMYAYMISNPSAQSARPDGAWAAPSLTGDWLAVTGEIDANSAKLLRVRHLQTVAIIPPITAGPYSLELYDAGNHLLASYPFTPQPATPDAPNVMAFDQVVNFVANTAQVRVVRLADSAVLATQDVPAHSPTISNVMLVGAPNPVTGTVTLQWTAGDADGNPLTFDIYYSRDGGASARPLQLNVAGNSAQIDASRLGGTNSSTALFQVMASDGVNTTQADSPLFTMANKLPQPAIISPAYGTHRHWGQMINFSGQAHDAQDGYVAPAGLAWSDQAGALGTGPQLSVSDLPVGTNVITLTATDSANQKASTSIIVVVDDNLDLPGPTLSVGPQQFSWSFTSSASPTQTDQLTLDNVGGGSLSWTASTDAPWLKLDITSGATPGLINLTTDPIGVPTGTEKHGHIFLNTVGVSPAQQVIVPVTLAVGVSASDPPPPPPTTAVYMPLVAQ